MQQPDSDVVGLESILKRVYFEHYNTPNTDHIRKRNIEVADRTGLVLPPGKNGSSVWLHVVLGQTFKLVPYTLIVEELSPDSSVGQMGKRARWFCILWPKKADTSITEDRDIFSSEGPDQSLTGRTKLLLSDQNTFT